MTNYKLIIWLLIVLILQNTQNNSNCLEGVFFFRRDFDADGGIKEGLDPNHYAIINNDSVIYLSFEEPHWPLCDFLQLSKLAGGALEQGDIFFQSFICDEDGIEMVNNNIRSVYERMDLNYYDGLSLLYKASKECDFDLIVHLYNRIVRSICIDELAGYDEINGDEIGSLVQGGLVEVILVQEEWVLVRLIRTGEIYWTYLSCLE